MQKTLGWKIVEEELAIRLGDLGTQLLNSKETIEMVRLQGRMKELKSILSFVEIKKDNRNKAKQILGGK